MPETLRSLPQCEQFEGLYFDPDTMTCRLQYKNARKPSEICELRFPFEASDRLVGWMVDLLEKLDSDSQHGRRLRALHLRGAPPKGHA